MPQARPAPAFLVYFFLSAFAVAAAFMWMHGITEARLYKEKGTPAIMTAFELRGTRHAPKSPTYYRYWLNLDGRYLESELTRKLVLRTPYDVLVSPKNRDEFVIGTSQDSILSLYASQIAGGFWGWVFVFIWPSVILVCVVSMRKEMAARRLQRQRTYILPS